MSTDSFCNIQQSYHFTKMFFSLLTENYILCNNLVVIYMAWRANSKWKLISFFPCCSLELIAVDNINTAIRNCDPSKTLVALLKPEAQLPVVHSFAAAVYQTELFNLQQQNAVVRVKSLQLAYWSCVVRPWKSTNIACCCVKSDIILLPWCYVLHESFWLKRQYLIAEFVSCHTSVWLSSCVATNQWTFFNCCMFVMRTNSGLYIV